MIYGYARVSTDRETEWAQIEAMTTAGVIKVFRETRGAKTDRAQLRKVLAVLEAGDVLMVTRLDRLARPTRDRLNVLAAITDRKVGFRSLRDNRADPTRPHGRLMVTILGGLAEFERELIRVRTGEGCAPAVARDVKLGRKPKLTLHQRKEICRRRENGEPVREIARSYNVHNSTISRLAT